MTRIISGKYKGRRITAPKKLPVRPTTDMAKEALFNILRNRFHFSTLRVLDLYAGTGNMSYEFGSRGTQDITAVDGHYACVQFISKTAEDFEFPIMAIKSDVFKFLERGAQGTYDVIFADPPYDIPQEAFEQLINLVFEKQLLSEDGMLIVEHSKHTHLDDHSHFEAQRHYGGTAFSFFGYPEEAEEADENE